MIQSCIFLVLVLSIFCRNIKSSGERNDFKLEFVILVTRHGDRAPVFDPLSEVEWNCSIPLQISTSPYNDQSNVFRLFNIRTSPPTMIPGTCQMGQLTIKGMKEHIMLGQNLSKVYSSFIYDPSQVKIRSSDQDRTIQSAQSFMHGFFPPTVFPDYRFDIDVKVAGKEDILINYYASPLPCPILFPMASQIRSGYEWQKLINDTMPFRKYLAKNLGYDVSKVSYFMIHDSLFCLVNNGYPLPGDLTMDDYWKIEDYATMQFNQFYYLNETFLKLGIGHFFGESIVDLFTSVISGNKSVEGQRFQFYSAHDTTIAPLGIVLGLVDAHYSKWPGYASNIRLELYKDAGGDYYVRGLYDGKEVAMKGCGGGSTYCKWSDFLGNSRKWIPDDWEKECKYGSS